MISLLTESYSNTIKTKGALELNSNIKKMVQGLVSIRPNIFEKIKNMDPGMEFREYHTDILGVVRDNYNNEEILIENGYEKTDYYSYHAAAFNTVRNVENYAYIADEEDGFINSIPINSTEGYKELSYFHADNFVVFYMEGETKYEYFYEFDESIKIYDFKIDSDYFVHIMYLDNADGCVYYLRSHLSKPFASLNVHKNEINLGEVFISAKLSSGDDPKFFIKTGPDYILTADEDYNYTRYNMSKKYFFTDSGKIYFNKTETDIFSDEIFIENDIQLNNLNMYNYINFLGLNDYKVRGERKISTFENSLFLDIFKNKFDNTVNGGLNYFDSKVYCNNGGTFKDYHVNINDENFSVSGNFLYEYRNGIYEIIIRKGECELIEIDGKLSKSLKIVKIPDSPQFYFCNLKFIKKKYTYDTQPITYRFSALDKYSFAIKKNDDYKIEKMYNSNKETSKILNNSIIKTSKNLNDIVYFDGRKIVFENFYDFKECRFKYGNREKNVSHRDRISKKKAKLYYFSGSHFEKDNYIYFRECGVLKYSESKSFNFELVDSKGRITNFWKENQGTTVCFENKDGIVSVTNNSSNADFRCEIPLISSYINETEENFRNISVIDNDDLEVEIQYNDRILMTSKFMDIPLFYKFYMEKQINDTFELYDSDGIEITNYLTEPYRNGYMIYFNAAPGKKYYFGIDGTEYNYVQHMKAYENINETYRFDNTGIIELEETFIKTFGLYSQQSRNANSKYELFLHNSKTKEVNKIELAGTELNKNFDLDITADKIILKCDGDMQDISFVVVDLKSILHSDKLTFIKNSRYEQVFISKEKPEIPKDIDYSLIKVDTAYEIGSKILENENGTFSISCPIEDEIPIMKNEKYHIHTGKSFAVAIEEDEFYSNNFKGIGVELITKPSEFKKIFETSNDSFALGGGNE